ncbi:MAG: superoxide dismutase [Planctomycetes bacterium]|nr:superoxide dismutase [Planctomycetota bacterium]
MFERVKLPYGYADLEPYLDAATVETHYEKHHKAYTDNFNELVKKVPAFAGKSAEEILMHLDQAPPELQKGLRNNGGGYYNHNLYFAGMCPGGKPPSPALEKQIQADFGSLDALLDKLFAAATAELFGSGWAWLILENGKLAVTISANQDNPLMQGNPNLLLPVDMWEHAYYLKYRNDKKAYVHQYYHLVNWETVEERFERAR